MLGFLRRTWRYLWSYSYFAWLLFASVPASYSPLRGIGGRRLCSRNYESMGATPLSKLWLGQRVISKIKSQGTHICYNKERVSMPLIMSLKTKMTIKSSKLSNQYTTLQDNSNFVLLQNSEFLLIFSLLDQIFFFQTKALNDFNIKARRWHPPRWKQRGYSEYPGYHS